MPALSAFADLLDKAADLLTDATVTSDELCKRGLPGQSGDENKLLTRTRDQVVKRFGPSDDLRVNVGYSYGSYPNRCGRIFRGGNGSIGHPNFGSRRRTCGNLWPKGGRRPRNCGGRESGPTICLPNRLQKLNWPDTSPVIGTWLTDWFLPNTATKKTATGIGCEFKTCPQRITQSMV